jgi:hypothetical protein
MMHYGYSIHSNYIRVTTPVTYYNPILLVQQQFDLIEYNDTEIQRLIDYFFVKHTGDLGHTKYNFNFTKYSEDFNTYGSKLMVFTDFIVRCIYLSGVIPGSVGYGLPESFENKYFLIVPDLGSYLETNGITSVFPNQYKQVNNINWESYKKLNPDLNQNASVAELREHYYMYGQFEIRPFNFNSIGTNNIQRAENAVGLIYSPGSARKIIGTGFLTINNSPTSIVSNRYLIIPYHLIENSKNKVTIRAIFSIQNPNDFLKVPTTLEAEFRIIGYHKNLDLLICAYDPTAIWNIENKIDITKVATLTINDTIELQNNDIVNYIGNIQNNSLNSVLSGNVIDNNYYGEFGKNFDLAPPNTYIININSSPGVSGSPLLVYRNTSYVAIGMLTSRLIISPIYTQVLPAAIINEYLQRSIDYYAFITNYYKGNLFNVFTSLQSADANVFCWLGVEMEYYDAILSRQKYDALASFNYYGGVLITDIILGFNTVTRRFVTNVNDLVDLNTIQLTGPFFNTIIQNRLIQSGYIPIVLKSMTTYVGGTGEGTYQTYYFGKYGDQRSLSTLTYRLVPVGTYLINDLGLAREYANLTYNIYQDITYNYYYFDGINWIEESFTQSFTENDLVTYKDNLGNQYLQNPYNYPIVMLPYTKYYYDTFSSAAFYMPPSTYWDGYSTSGSMTMTVGSNQAQIGSNQAQIGSNQAQIGSNQGQIGSINGGH